MTAVSPKTLQSGLALKDDATKMHTFNHKRQHATIEQKLDMLCLLTILSTCFTSKDMKHVDIIVSISYLNKLPYRAKPPTDWSIYKTRMKYKACVL